jgi:hypothetical protein
VNRKPLPATLTAGPGDEKICGRCGRKFAWRPRWARNWQSIKYCSDQCRQRPLRPRDLALESSIMRLANQRAAGATLCPSEASREVFGSVVGLSADAMQRTRAAARRLVAAGRLVIVQGGHVVDPSTAKGAIRLRRT